MTTLETILTIDGFKDLNLSETLRNAVTDMKFEKPSSIQAEAIPQIMMGKDIIAKAPTGSGKTAAFAIPILEKLDLNSDNKNIQALILCPTRELVIQVHKEFEKLSKYMENVSVVSVYGGQQIEKQFNALQKSPQIVVATPGRLMDHLRRGSIKLDFVSMVVLDEADEMLDMGFREDIHVILEDVPVNRQTILFSATMAKDIVELTKKFQNNPGLVDVTNNIENTPDIEQMYFEVVEKAKMELLTRLLDLHRVKLSLVFCNTKSSVDKAVEFLKSRGYFADALHGDMNQTQREKVMRGFRNGTVEILVATDVAGRGIDVKNIEAVFNYDLPRDDEDYIHRIGRTGRAGTSGKSFTFVSKRQVQHLKRIERANGMLIHKREVPSFEELESSRADAFMSKISNIIQCDDLSVFSERVMSMTNENVSIVEVAAALLKMSMNKESRKINRNIVFEDDSNEDESGSRRSRGGRGSRERNFSGGNSRGGRNRGFGDKDRSFDDKKRNYGSSKQRNDNELSLDEMIKAVKSLRENPKKFNRDEEGTDFSKPKKDKKDYKKSFDKPRRAKKESGKDFAFDKPKRNQKSKTGKSKKYGPR